MPETRYPGYNVLAKANTPSWNEKTRQVIAERLLLGAPRFFTSHEHATVTALAARIVPRDPALPEIPVASLVDDKLARDRNDGFRTAGMPRQREAWRLGLSALDATCQALHRRSFTDLDGGCQDDILRAVMADELNGPEWQGISCKLLFEKRMGRDIVFAYYAHPYAWNEIGWGGPASPRGYVRMGFDARDPWEAAEVKQGDIAAARRLNRRVG